MQIPTNPVGKTEFLRFSLLANMQALMPVDQLAAVFRVDVTQVTAIPHMPPWVMGVYNWRGEVLWIVDLGHLIGDTPWYEQAKPSTSCNILVLEKASQKAIEQHHLGLLVWHVEGIERLTLETMRPSTGIPEPLMPFLHGYWLDMAGEMIALLDSTQILAHMPT